MKGRCWVRAYVCRKNESTPPLGIDPDNVVMGKLPLFTQYEEAKIVEHIKTMASFGYGYTVQECVDLASDFATQFRVFSQHFGNMTRPLELGIFASFYTKLGKNTLYNKNKNIKYFVYSTSYSSLTHKQILKSDLQSDLPFVVGAQKNPLIKMVLLSTHNICFA